MLVYQRKTWKYQLRKQIAQSFLALSQIRTSETSDKWCAIGPDWITIQLTVEVNYCYSH